MSTPPNRLRSLLRAGLALFPFAVLSGTSRAPCADEGLALRIAPSVSELSDCGDAVLDVKLELSNPARLDVGGYQAFLRFPADLFEAVRFDSVAVNGFVQVAGPGPIGTGFRPCSPAPSDGWADLAGEDVVAVVATVFAAGSSGVLSAELAELGRFVFRPTGRATATASGAFRLNEEDCVAGIDSRSRVFDPAGGSLPFTAPEPVQVTVQHGGAQARAFTCQEVDSDVQLSWVAPLESSYTGYRIYRNSEAVATFPLKSILSWKDQNAPAEGTLVYRLVVLSGTVEGCSRTCTIERQAGSTFVRGDANLDGSVNITDAVAILNHLFRGIAISCEDAGDADDSGGVNITDAIGLLAYLFQSGPQPPAPFPGRGQDPTPDALADCAP